MTQTTLEGGKCCGMWQAQGGSGCSNCPTPPSRAGQLEPERGRTHGDFGENAKFTLQARDLLRSMKPGWSNCTPEQALALDEMMLKIGRILSGGAKVKEHWDDIEGYSKLGGKCAE